MIRLAYFDQATAAEFIEMFKIKAFIKKGKKINIDCDLKHGSNKNNQWKEVSLLVGRTKYNQKIFISTTVDHLEDTI